MWLITIQWKDRGYPENYVIDGSPEAWLHVRTQPVVLLWARSISDEAAERLSALKWEEA